MVLCATLAGPLQYVLALSQFQAPGFAPASKEPLVHLPITITSVNAAGVAPRSYAPPGYAEKHEGDYMTTMGYLENGNQRYVRALDMMWYKRCVRCPALRRPLV